MRLPPWMSTDGGREVPESSVERSASTIPPVTILNQIYEVDFKGFSYGSRPGCGPHQALDAMSVGIHGKRVKWVPDAILESFC